MNLNKLFNIKNKVVIITGGSGFLGSYYIKFLKSLGAKMINLDIHGNPPIDITNEIDVKKNISLIISKYRRIDVLINNASLNIHIEKKAINSNKTLDFFSKVENYPLDAFKKGLEIDLIGSFIVSKTVLPYMKKQKKGVILNIGSVYGFVAPDQRLYQGIKNPLNPKADIVKPIYYSVAKAGMWGLTSYLASYAAPEIRVNQLTLGGIQHNESEEFIKRYSYKTMLGRMGKIEDIYGALLFLTTDASLYVTATNLIVDGGLISW